MFSARGSFHQIHVHVRQWPPLVKKFLSIQWSDCIFGETLQPIQGTAHNVGENISRQKLTYNDVIGLMCFIYLHDSSKSLFLYTPICTFCRCPSGCVSCPTSLFWSYKTSLISPHSPLTSLTVAVSVYYELMPTT